MREDTCPRRPGSGSRQPRREAPENKPAGLRHQHCPLCSPQGAKPCPGGSSPRAAQPYRSFQELPQSEERRGEETRPGVRLDQPALQPCPPRPQGPQGPPGRLCPLPPEHEDGIQECHRLREARFACRHGAAAGASDLGTKILLLT